MRSVLLFMIFIVLIGISLDLEAINKTLQTIALAAARP